MKKRHILFLVTALVMIATIILPALACRISYEHKHRGYVTAIELDDTAAQFKKSDFVGILRDYRASGVTTALLRESKDGGFNISLLAMAKEAGLDTAISVYGGNEKGLTYWKNLKKAIEDYDVKYLLLKKTKTENPKETPFAQLITDYGLTLVLAENGTHLSNEKPPEFDSCMAAANGRVLRCYETMKTPAQYLTSGKNDPNLLYYHMINSARDRNTEFLLINQITDAAPTPEENAKVTQASVLKFCVWMHKLGYTSAPTGSLAGYTTNLRLINAGSAYLGILMLMYMLYILLGKSNARLEWILFSVAVAAFAVTWVFPMSLVLLYPTLFAPLGACFCFTLIYAYAQKVKARLNGFAYTGSILAIAFVSLLTCCAVLSAMLSGTEYYLNIYIFRGVSVTLLLPILYALILLYCKEEKKKIDITELKTTIQNARNQIRPWHIIAAILVVLVLVVYLLRSGNTKISGFENKLRNIMAEISFARPRTKEFLIGWPALALFAYYIKNNHCKLMTWAFAAASGILFASIMNTFCHVFTDATTSALRTVNGLVFAIPFVLIFSVVNHIFLKLIQSRKLDKQSDL